MRILFMGTPDFAVFALRALIETGEDVIGVVTQPDQPRGRGYVMTPPPVKVCAEENGIPVYQPEKLKTQEFSDLLFELDPELIVVAAYGKILPAAVLDYPACGCINIHGSLLPEYRGAAPIQRAIMDGKTVTGITTMMMDAGLDTGDILLTGEVKIEPEDNFETVHDKMGACGAEVLLRTLAALRNGTLRRIPQDGSRSTYAAKIEKSDCILHFSDTAESLHNRIRALSPFPLAFTHLPNGKLLKITEARVSERKKNDDVPAGTVIATDGGNISVACGTGVLDLLGVLPEGKGRMTAAAFLNGHGVKMGDLLGGND